MRFRWSYTIYLLAAAAALWFILSRREVILPHLRQISPLFLALISLAAVCHLFLEALRFRYLLEVFELVVPFREWFGLTVCNAMFSYYLPVRGGGALRAVYLKHRYGFPYSRYASLLAGSTLICFSLSAAVGLTSLTLLSLVAGERFPRLFWVVLALLAASVGGMALLGLCGGRRIGTPSTRLNAVIVNFTDGLPRYRTGGRPVVLFGLFHLLSLLLLAVRLWLAFLAIGIAAGPLRVLVMQSLASCSLVLSATPGNIGITEGIVVSAAGLMKVPADTAALAALLDRAVVVTVVFALGTLFGHLVLRGLPALRKSPPGASPALEK